MTQRELKTLILDSSAHGSAVLTSENVLQFGDKYKQLFGNRAGKTRQQLFKLPATGKKPQLRRSVIERAVLKPTKKFTSTPLHARQKTRDEDINISPIDTDEDEDEEDPLIVATSPQKSIRNDSTNGKIDSVIEISSTVSPGKTTLLFNKSVKKEGVSRIDGSTILRNLRSRSVHESRKQDVSKTKSVINDVDEVEIDDDDEDVEIDVVGVDDDEVEVAPTQGVVESALEVVARNSSRLEELVAKMREKALNKSVQTSRKKSDVVSVSAKKKLARNIFKHSSHSDNESDYDESLELDKFGKLANFLNEKEFTFSKTKRKSLLPWRMSGDVSDTGRLNLYPSPLQIQNTPPKLGKRSCYNRKVKTNEKLCKSLLKGKGESKLQALRIFDSLEGAAASANSSLGNNTNKRKADANDSSENNFDTNLAVLRYIDTIKKRKTRVFTDREESVRNDVAEKEDDSGWDYLDEILNRKNAIDEGATMREKVQSGKKYGKRLIETPNREESKRSRTIEIPKQHDEESMESPRRRSSKVSTTINRGKSLGKTETENVASGIRKSGRVRKDVTVGSNLEDTARNSVQGDEVDSASTVKNKSKTAQSPEKLQRKSNKKNSTLIVADVPEFEPISASCDDSNKSKNPCVVLISDIIVRSADSTQKKKHSNNPKAKRRKGENNKTARDTSPPDSGVGGSVEDSASTDGLRRSGRARRPPKTSKILSVVLVNSSRDLKKYSAFDNFEKPVGPAKKSKSRFPGTKTKSVKASSVLTSIQEDEVCHADNNNETVPSIAKPHGEISGIESLVRTPLTNNKEPPSTEDTTTTTTKKKRKGRSTKSVVKAKKRQVTKSPKKVDESLDVGGGNDSHLNPESNQGNDVEPDCSSNGTLMMNGQMVCWVCAEPSYSQIPNKSLMVAHASYNLSEGSSAGILKIPPGEKKPTQVAPHHTLYFVILEGEALVKVENETRAIPKFGIFMVPKGCKYFIKNAKESEELIMEFVKFKPVA